MPGSWRVSTVPTGVTAIMSSWMIRRLVRLLREKYGGSGCNGKPGKVSFNDSKTYCRLDFSSIIKRRRAWCISGIGALWEGVLPASHRRRWFRRACLASFLLRASAGGFSAHKCTAINATSHARPLTHLLPSGARAHSGQCHALTSLPYHAHALDGDLCNNPSCSTCGSANHSVLVDHQVRHSKDPFHQAQASHLSLLSLTPLSGFELFIFFLVQPFLDAGISASLSTSDLLTSSELLNRHSEEETLACSTATGRTSKPPQIELF
jgi:hypothetical protein